MISSCNRKRNVQCELVAYLKFMVFKAHLILENYGISENEINNDQKNLKFIPEYKLKGITFSVTVE